MNSENISMIWFTHGFGFFVVGVPLIRRGPKMV